MRRRSIQKRSQHHLKHLVEQIVADEYKLSLPARGLAFIVDEVEATGNPPQRVKVWATLHFLSLGSPFCCSCPDCHLMLFPERQERLSDALRRRLGLRQQVELEFIAIRGAPHPDVEFDNCFTGCVPSIDWYDVDRRDALGRTALMRAAARGNERLVEDLLAAGADPSAVDRHGRNIVEQVAKGSVWIATLLEQALAQRGRGLPEAKKRTASN